VHVGRELGPALLVQVEHVPARVIVKSETLARRRRHQRLLEQEARKEIVGAQVMVAVDDQRLQVSVLGESDFQVARGAHCRLAVSQRAVRAPIQSMVRSAINRIGWPDDSYTEMPTQWKTASPGFP
jgi:hypothetical protein